MTSCKRKAIVWLAVLSAATFLAFAISYVPIQQWTVRRALALSVLDIKETESGKITLKVKLTYDASRLDPISRLVAPSCISLFPEYEPWNSNSQSHPLLRSLRGNSSSILTTQESFPLDTFDLDYLVLWANGSHEGEVILEDSGEFRSAQDELRGGKKVRIEFVCSPMMLVGEHQTAFERKTGRLPSLPRRQGKVSPKAPGLSSDNKTRDLTKSSKGIRSLLGLDAQNPFAIDLSVDITNRLQFQP